YRKFKDAANVLSLKQESQQNLYARSFAEPGFEGFDLKEFRINATLFDLLSAFRTVLQGIPAEQMAGLNEETFTVQQKIGEIMGGFKKSKRLEFTSLFSSVSSKLEVIVTFLAILELIRTKRIIARQAQLFSKIWLYERRAKTEERGA
ncbi:segregation and condensation protein A, partial [Candidatus Poribacteria bacterium]